MSLVLGMTFTNRAIIISDGRARNVINNSIINEKCDKTRKINDSVILGFSGELEVSLWLLEQFENIHKRNIPDLKSDDVAKILCNIAEEGVNYRKKLNKSNATYFQMIVTGLNSKKIMSLYSFGVPTSFKIKESIPTVHNFIYSILSPNGTDFGSVFEDGMKNHPGKDLEFYYRLLFSKASEIDDSINTNLFVKSIEL